MIRVGPTFGTAFTIERHGKQYLVTAKHIVKGLPDQNATVQLRQNGNWRNLTADVIHCENPSVDIAVLNIRRQLSPEFPIEATLKDVLLGQEVYFLGYPYGLSTVVDSNGYPLPLVKHGILSAIGQSEKTGVVLYIDGFNNPGFSGGPVVAYKHFPDKLQVIGVISGYWSETDKVRVGQRSTPLTVQSNSGILKAYSIQHAIDAIDEFEEVRDEKRPQH